MENTRIESIDEVVESLDQIIEECIEQENCAGYFAALYRKVTLKVKEGIDENFFEDGPRMEQLDVVFAKRYIDAYYGYKNDQNITKSWLAAFQLNQSYWPIVLQHLLIGMNAHINLDLGIAAAQISEGKNINDLHTDFNRINDILSSLVHEVDKDLGEIWPTFRFLVKIMGKVDDFLVDFSMKIARDGAWKFASELAQTPDHLKDEMIHTRDGKVCRKAGLVSNPGFFVGTIFKFIRLGERGNVAKKILNMKN